MLGVILYECVTGRPPFQATADGDSARKVLTRHLQLDPPSPREYNAALGPAIEATLLRALAKRPEDRYPTGAALLYALHDAYEQDRGRRSGRPGTGPLGQRNPRSDEAMTPTVPPSEPSEPATALPTIVATVPTAARSEIASAPLSAAPNDAVPVPHPQAVASPIIDRPAPVITTVTASSAVELAEPAPRVIPAAAHRTAVAPMVSRLWLVVLVGLLALCAGLACGLFFAIW